MVAKSTDKKSLGSSLKELEKITQWFEDQEEVDVEKGIVKVKEGAALIKDTKKRLEEIENEFEDVKKSLK